MLSYLFGDVKDDTNVDRSVNSDQRTDCFDGLGVKYCSGQGSKRFESVSGGFPNQFFCE